MNSFCQGPQPKIEREWVKVALQKMKDGKAVGTSGIAAEMLKLQVILVLTS